ncbi:MAG: hypothetical protein ACPGUH_03120 [Winogradskyella sp.]
MIVNFRRLSLFFIFFVAFSAYAQNFETHYNHAKADFKNEVFHSKTINKALASCPDITKYPELLVFKGVSLDFNGQKILATKYIKLALNYLKDKQYIYECHSYLAYMHSSSDDLEKAIYHYKTALKLARELNIEMYIYENQFNLLLIEFEVLTEDKVTEKKQQLKKMLDFCYAMSKETEDSIRLMYISIVVELSDGLLVLQDYKRVQNSINTSINVKALKKDNQGQYYNSKSRLEYYLKNYDTALKYCDSSYYISKNYLYKEDLLEVYYTYKQIYQQQGKPDLALKYSDSILKIEEDFKIQELESGINLTDENILFKKTQDLTEKKITKLSILLILILCAAIALIILLIYSRKTRYKLKEKLFFYKEKYNSLWANYQLSTKQLENLRQELIKQNKKGNHELNTVLRDLSIHVNTNKDDQHKHINIAKENFINKLTEKANYLNDTEKLICFFINLNLSHQKIASLIGKTEKSIDSYKYRINTKVKKHNNTTAEHLIKQLT